MSGWRRFETALFKNTLKKLKKKKNPRFVDTYRFFKQLTFKSLK